MNRFPLFVVIGLGVLLHPISRADTPAPAEAAELTALRTAYKTQQQAIETQYRAKLDALVKTQVQQGNLQGAVATRTELKSLDGPATASPPTATLSANTPALRGDGNPLFSGTKWFETSGASVTEFRANGVWSECYRGREAFGRWKTNGTNTSVVVTKPDGKTLQYDVSPDGATCIRLHDKLPYKKVVTYLLQETLAGTTVESPAGSSPNPAPSGSKSGGDSNPFGALR